MKKIAHVYHELSFNYKKLSLLYYPNLVKFLAAIDLFSNPYLIIIFKYTTEIDLALKL